MRSRRYRDGVDGGILDDDRLRVVLLGMIFLAAFGIIAGRLYFLQLHHGEEHRKLIARQSERRVRIPGLRGKIYSSDNKVLAENRQAYDLLFFPSEMHRGSRKKTVAYMNECAMIIAGKIGRSKFPSAEEFNKHLRQYPGVPMTVFQDLNTGELARAFEASRNMTGVDIQFSPIRSYPCGDLACHIIGYTRKADAATASDREDFFYYNPDQIGKDGIEKSYDTFNDGNTLLGLRAFPGRSVIQVNNVGYAQKELLGRSEPIHGNNVILTIDSRAQELAETLLGNYSGAIVVVDADNGDIICAASSPRMDLSRFSPILEPQYFQSLLNNPEKPMINRAFQAIYPPGSTLKPLMCLAFLRAGIDPEEEIYCYGESEVGNATIRCSAHRYSSDDLNMIRALEKSCNNYMIHHATSIGLDAIYPVLESAGFGKKAQLPLPVSAGDMPSSALKRRRYGMPWNTYDTALLSIGQGIISVTPLQLALYTAAIANGGTLWQAQLVKKLTDNRGITRFEQKPAVAGQLLTTPEHLEIIRQGMFNVVNSSGGSGRQAKLWELTVYGKTGTAEIGTKNAMHNITHFIAFTTYQKRTYAMAVTIEDGQSGGRTCAPLAAEFFRRYLLP